LNFLNFCCICDLYKFLNSKTYFFTWIIYRTKCLIDWAQTWPELKTFGHYFESGAGHSPNSWPNTLRTIYGSRSSQRAQICEDWSLGIGVLSGQKLQICYRLIPGQRQKRALLKSFCQPSVPILLLFYWFRFLSQCCTYLASWVGICIRVTLMMSNLKFLDTETINKGVTRFVLGWNWLTKLSFIHSEPKFIMDTINIDLVMAWRVRGS
jgi:hypothetical protein